MKKLIIGGLAIFVLSACSAEKDKKEKVNPQQLISDLFLAVLENDVASVKELVSNPNTDLMAYDEQGYTALMRASQEGKSPYIVETLIEGGAKIYQPSLNDKDYTAFDNINPQQSEIIKHFENEKNRLASILENLIKEEDFISAVKFTEDNFLPIDLILPISNKTSLELTIKILSSDNTLGIEYIKSKINDHLSEGKDISFLMENINILASKIKSVDIFDFSLKSINSSEKMVVLLEDDFKDTLWLTSKLNTINFNGFKTNIENHLDDLTKSLVELKDQNLKENFVALHTSIQNSQTLDYYKSAIFQDALRSLESSLDKNSDQILWISSLIDIWKDNRKSFESTGYSFDEHIYLILKGINRKNIDVNELDLLFTKISLFAPSYENKSEESIKYLISTNGFDLSLKKKILEFLIKRTQSLPDDIISYVIEHGGVPELDLLLDSKLPFNPDLQAKSILTVLETTKSGDMAYSFLVVLNEKDIPFDTEYGKKALEYSIKKLWEENDSTYRIVYDYLVSLKKSPITVMTDDEIVFYLKLIMDYVKNGKTEWAQLTQFLDKINNPTLNSKPYTKENIYFLEKSDSSILNVSLLWDFIMEAFEVVSQNPSETDTILVIIRKLSEKFPKESFSFSFAGGNFVTSPNLSLVQNILSLSVLLTLSEREILEALKIPNEVAFSKSLNINPSPFSWDRFVQSDLFKYYSKKPKFWESVSDILFRSGRTFKFEKQKNYILFAKILLNSGKANRFPALKEEIQKSNMSYFSEEMICILDKERYENDFLDKTEEHSWVNLGSFEVLTSFKNKSCELSENLSSDDISLVRNFISNNLENPNEFSYAQGDSFSGMTPLKKGKCSSIVEQGQLYLHDYDPAGTVIKRPKNIDSLLGNRLLLFGFPQDQECYLFEYDFLIAYKAKTTFLNHWFKCAVDNNDSSLIRFFESLDKKHKIFPTDEDKGIRVCRW